MLLKKEIAVERIAHFFFQFDNGSMTEKTIHLGDVVTIVWNNTGHKEKITGKIIAIDHKSSHEITKYNHFTLNQNTNNLSIVIDGSVELHSDKKRIDSSMILNILYEGEIDPDEPFEEILFGRDTYKIFGIESLNEPHIIIPETRRYNGVNYKCIGIDDSTFYNCDKIRMITLPDTAMHIGHYAFFGCNHLASINIPDSVKLIETYAFMNCEELKVKVPNAVEIVADNAFFDVKNVLYNGNLPNAPWGGKLLNSIDITAEIIDYTINTYSTIYNVAKEGDVTIPMTFERSGKTYKVVELGNGLFAYADKLTSVNIPNTVKRIGENCFAECIGVESIDVPDSVLEIGDLAFKNVANVNYTGTAMGAPWGAKLLNGEEYIKEEHFEEFSLSKKNYSKVGITRSGNVLIPETFESNGINYIITEIADDAFYNCNELKTIRIPDSVKRIGDRAFANCSRLEVVAFYPEGMGRLLLPDTSLLEEIGEQAFMNCISLRAIRIPNNVNTIGKNAFDSCINLTSINTPDNCEYIPEGCFDTCFALMTVVISENVLRIGERAFHNCKYLTVTIPTGVEEIGEKAFFEVKEISYKGNAEGGPWGAKKWIEDEAPENPDDPTPPVTDPEKPGDPEIIYKDLVLSKTNLNDIAIIVDGVITIPETYEKDEDHFKITEIADGTFEGMENITSVIMPDTITKIGERAFHNCKYLISVKMSKNITIIKQHAFAYCNALTDVTIPSGVKVLNDNTFMYCIALTNITIPDSITAISNEVFYGCKSIESLTIPDSVRLIGEGAFYDVPSVYYNGTASGYPWGADKVNDKIINVVPDNPESGGNNESGGGTTEEKPSNPDTGEVEVVPSEDEWK